MTPFEKELQHLINKYSIENASNTPDFILAEYIRAFLEKKEVKSKREDWYKGKN